MLMLQFLFPIPAISEWCCGYFYLADKFETKIHAFNGLQGLICYQSEPTSVVAYYFYSGLVSCRPTISQFPIPINLCSRFSSVGCRVSLFIVIGNQFGAFPYLIIVVWTDISRYLDICKHAYELFEIFGVFVWNRYVSAPVLCYTPWPVPWAFWKSVVLRFRFFASFGCF